jgi:hypothetical protein
MVGDVMAERAGENLVRQVMVRVKCPVCQAGAALGYCNLCRGQRVIECEAAEQVILPAALTVKVGTLQIDGPIERAMMRTAMLGCECAVHLDGRRLHFTNLHLHLSAAGLVRATVEFFPKAAPAREKADTPLTVKAGGA